MAGLCESASDCRVGAAAAAAAPREEWAAIYVSLRASSGGHACGLVVPLCGGGWGWGLRGLADVCTERLDGAAGGLCRKLLLCLVSGEFLAQGLRRGVRVEVVLRRLVGIVPF